MEWRWIFQNYKSVNGTRESCAVLKSAHVKQTSFFFFPVLSLLSSFFPLSFLCFLSFLPDFLLIDGQKSLISLIGSTKEPLEKKRLKRPQRKLSMDGTLEGL